MSTYIHQLADWPKFVYNEEMIAPVLNEVRHLQGRLLGKMDALGFKLQTEAALQTLTLDVVKSSEIEGEILESAQVRSSIARRLGIDIATSLPADRFVEGVVEMMLNATQHYTEALTNDRLYDWQAALFPTGRRGMHKIITGAWRNSVMQVVSGGMGMETIHFEAPTADKLMDEMTPFIAWYNSDTNLDPVIKAAIAHLWFITIHPFDDGNGRIARAITDMQLAHADGTSQRFYSISAQIRKDRKEYYNILELTQKGGLDITRWITWFLICMEQAIKATNETLSTVLHKAKFWDTHASVVLNARQRLMINKLLDGFEGKLTTTKWAKLTKCSQDTALRDIQNLVDKSILIKEDAGGRSTSYVLK